MEEKDIDKLDITAIANDENMKIEILGNENFVEGQNLVSIIVTGEDEKDTVTYQIKVNKIIKSTEIVGKTSDNLNQQEKAQNSNFTRNTKNNYCYDCYNRSDYRNYICSSRI